MAKSRKISLAAFLRRLWSRPDLMERFSQSRAGRQEVLKQFNLSARHSRLLLDGCMRDLVVELAGGAKLAEYTTGIINCDHGGADVECGHPECKAFMAVVAKRPLRKKKR
ncbi:MAG TPA: hypothetical protein VL742_03220 [Casimicrobiaceae bacterium]|nr:hypothetical protein [Casimicrobiaceae bacterium]